MKEGWEIGGWLQGREERMREGEGGNRAGSRKPSNWEGGLSLAAGWASPTREILDMRARPSRLRVHEFSLRQPPTLALVVRPEHGDGLMVSA